MTDTSTEGSRFAFQTPVRLMWPNVITAKPMLIGGKPKGDPEYSTRFFMPKDHPDVKTFSMMLARVKASKFGKDAKVSFRFQMGDKMHAKWEAKGKAKGRDFVQG